MDALLLTACLLGCLIIAIFIPLALLYVIPVRSVLSFTIRENSARDAFTITWGVLGARIEHDRMGTRMELLVGRRVLKTILPDRITMGSRGDRIPPGSPKKSPRFSGNLIKPIEMFGSVIWQESRFMGAKGKIVLGLGDPALTGLCYGYYWACRFMLEALHIRIEVEPIFDREVFSCDMDIRMDLCHPLRVIIALFRLMKSLFAEGFTTIFRHNSRGAAA
nr:DUF2953 domain-containing protein [uncultured Methanoregula sp.]